MSPVNVPVFWSGAVVRLVLTYTLCPPVPAPGRALATNRARFLARRSQSSASAESDYCMLLGLDGMLSSEDDFEPGALWTGTSETRAKRQSRDSNPDYETKYVNDTDVYCEEETGYVMTDDLRNASLSQSNVPIQAFNMEMLALVKTKKTEPHLHLKDARATVAEDTAAAADGSDGGIVYSGHVDRIVAVAPTMDGQQTRLACAVFLFLQRLARKSTWSNRAH